MYDSGDFEFLKLGANLATLAIGAVSALTYYVCWRWSEAARVRRMAERGRAGFSSLPSPVPVLPRWLGLIGGHTLQMKMTKVISRLRLVSLRPSKLVSTQGALSQPAQHLALHRLA